MALAAEAVGFDSVWMGDHLLYRDPGDPERGPWDAWTILAGLAAVTQRVRVGPLVACLAFHRPGMLARMAATVNEIAGGRLTLGVGAGWNEPEFRAFGVPFDHRVARFEESFDVIRRLLAGERVTAHGAFVEVEDAVLYPRIARAASVDGRFHRRARPARHAAVGGGVERVGALVRERSGRVRAGERPSLHARARSGVATPPRSSGRSASMSRSMSPRGSGPSKRTRRRSRAAPGGSPTASRAFADAGATRRSSW